MPNPLNPETMAFPVPITLMLMTGLIRERKMTTQHAATEASRPRLHRITENSRPGILRAAIISQARLHRITENSSPAHRRAPQVSR